MLLGAHAESLQVCLTLCNPMDYIACKVPLSMGFFQARILEWVARPSSKDLPDPGIEHMSPATPELAGGFFITEVPGNPKISGG